MDRGAGNVASAEVLRRLRSRKDFLKLMGGAGIGAAVGSNILLRQAFAQTAVVDDPTDLHFSITSQYRPFDVISKNFIEHSDDFDADQGLYTSLAPNPESNPGNVAIGSGVLSVTSNARFFTLFRTNKTTLAPYAAVIVDVESFSSSAASENTVYAGLVKDASNYVAAWYNSATNKVGIDAVVGGTVNTLVERGATLPAPVRLAFVLNSKEVTALADFGDGPFDGWKPVANYPNPPEVSGDPAITPGLSQYIDLRNPSVLAQYKYGFGVRGDSGTIVLDKAEAGYWGRAGVRDPHICTWADGTPYIKDNKLYLTLTNAGCDFFATAHWGVYTLDLSNYTSPDALEEVGKLFFKRVENNPDNPDNTVKVFGDHAGHIVYDDAAGKFLIGASTWGDFTYRGVQVNYTQTSENVLRDVHVLEAQKLNLPRTPDIAYKYRGNWDPHFLRVARQWYVAFVDSPSQGGSSWWHYPALAKGSTLDRLHLVGAESDLNQTEGVVLQKVSGKWYLLCSSGRDERGNLYPGATTPGSATYRIYLPQRDDDPNNSNGHGLKFFGTLDAPYVSNIPHPMITPLPVSGNTKWIMLTFDGTDFYGWDANGTPILDYGTHGDFYVMDGQPIEQGYEFPPRTP